MEYNEAEKHPAFYMLLQRMEESKLIKKSYEWLPNEEGHTVRNSVYKATAKGKKAYRYALDFYNKGA
jgi:DNA-binding PadR family transcriptional regulator